jgi:hypothetical protein
MFLRHIEWVRTRYFLSESPDASPLRTTIQPYVRGNSRLATSIFFHLPCQLLSRCVFPWRGISADSL